MAAVLLNAVSCQSRLLSRAREFPALFLHMLAEGPAIEPKRRKALAAQLLALDECCLARPYSDMALKYRRRYLDDVRDMAASGKVSARLGVRLLLFRQHVPLHNQRLEGLASIVQRSAGISPNANLPYISDALKLRIG